MIRVKVRGAAEIAKLMGGREHLYHISAGSTLAELLDILAARHGPAFKKRLFQEESKRIRDDLRLLLNGKDLEFAGGLNAELRDGDELVLIPPLAGG